MLFLQHIALLALTCCLAQAQTFEAASVKPTAGARPQPPTGGPGTSDPGRIHYPFSSLQFLVMRAYDVNRFQIVGPPWLGTERFDVDATLPRGTTMPQFRAMLQNLLAERFHLAIHRETREAPGYVLVVAKGKPKLKKSVDASPADDGTPAPLKLGPDGYFVPPSRQGLFFQLAGQSGARSNFRQATMQELAAALQSQLRGAVTDGTGLAGKYDFSLTYAVQGLDFGSGRIPVSAGNAGETPPDLFAALQEQLGLKLESKKVATNFILIDHVERVPSGN
jgi:uncharacterized protein (TIGR03435 family)